MKYIKKYSNDIFNGKGDIQELEDEDGSWCRASDVKELEEWYTASQESQCELLKRIALADRLAEVVARRLRNASYPDEEVAEAIAAYCSSEEERTAG